MMNEKLEATLMNEEELDQVAGGKGYAYVMETGGKYSVVSSNKKLSAAQAKALLQGKMPKQAGVNEDVVFNVLNDIPGSNLSKVKARLNQAYGGCSFKTIK
jgi:hypothetical protein